MKLSIACATMIVIITAVHGQQQISQECFTRPNDKDPKDCCKSPDMMPPRDQFAACMQKFPRPSSPPTPGSAPLGQNCMAECMLEKQGIMTGGVINKDTATSNLVALAGSSSDWQATTKKAVDTCYQKVSSIGTQKDSLGCSVIAGSFMECLPSTMFLNCPAASWTANAQCDQMKAHLQKGCPLMTLFKGPPPQ
ncbi:general odorant-binding protein 66-like [Armigeres subalbatus]|uniref:general odorant-binding protein 66-like n=1 Tax=Armigeres subalbatus TaxID=124917 RepID=UPI002ED01807